MIQSSVISVFLFPFLCSTIFGISFFLHNYWSFSFESELHMLLLVLFHLNPFKTLLIVWQQFNTRIMQSHSFLFFFKEKWLLLSPTRCLSFHKRFHIVCIYIYKIDVLWTWTCHKWETVFMKVRERMKEPFAVIN